MRISEVPVERPRQVPVEDEGGVLREVHAEEVDRREAEVLHVRRQPGRHPQIQGGGMRIEDLDERWRLADAERDAVEIGRSAGVAMPCRERPHRPDERGRIDRDDCPARS